MLLHAHHGFNGRVAVNDLVPGLLRLIPGVTVLDASLRAPGPCLLHRRRARALADAQRATLAAMAESGAGTLCTIFHSCHREAVALDATASSVRNWIPPAGREPRHPRRGRIQGLAIAPDPRAAIGEDRIEAAGEVAFTRLLEPELRKPPVV